MKEKPQGNLEGSRIGALLKTRVAVILSNWVFQGMRYMNVYEISLKLALDILLTAGILWLMSGPLSLYSFLGALIIAHTINWIINGHIFVLMRYVYPVPKTLRDFDEYVCEFKRHAENAGYIDGVAIYGSYCRGQLHKYSDLDVRVIVGRGILNGILGSLFCFKERLIAFFKVFPLDIYCCVETRSLSRLRDDEVPIILLDRSGILEKHYTNKEL